MTEHLGAAVVDSSALMCIFLEEPAWKLYLTELCKVDSLHMSTATRAETHLSAKGKKGQAGAVKKG